MPNQPRTPVEVDTELADLYDAQDKASQDQGRAMDSMRRQVGDTYDRRTGWSLSADEVLSKAIAMAKIDGTGSRISRALADYDAARADLRDIQADIAKRDQEYEAAGRWSRFFLARSSDGHVHSSQACSTCHHGRERTEFGWLPELSGKTEDDAVTEFGEKMCTVCFPSAPANPKFHAPGSRAQAVIDAKAAEKAAKQAAKDAKAITAPDGGVLKLTGRFGETISTEVTARRELLDQMWSIAFYGVLYPDNDQAEHKANVEILVAALAHKTGQDAEQIRAEYQAKADKKAAKGLKD